MKTTLGQDEGLEVFAQEVFSGGGAAVQRLRLQVARISPHFRTALLTGEAGVGKLTVARQIHRLSPVAALPFTSWRAADFAGGPNVTGTQGMIYLKGLETLGPGQQDILLRRLKGLERETRVVLGSECDLRGVVAAGRMRQELFQYASTLEIRIAPLRERLDDLAELAGGMMQTLGANAVFGASALERLQGHGWPGNLAELWLFCVGMAKMDGVIEAAELPRLDGRTGGSARVVRLDAVMQRHVMDVLQQCAGNKLRAAELLGISRSTLYRMLDSAAI
jgi:DNA-binding NtrC family response regulator